MFLACAAGCVYWYIGGRQITEADVHNFYRQENTWVEDRNGKELCTSIDAAYHGHMVASSSDGRRVIETDKAHACHDYEQMFVMLKALDGKVGGRLLTEMHQDVRKVDVSADKKTATVAVDGVFKAGMENLLLIKVSAKGTDTFVKRNGRLYRTSNDANVVME